MRKTIPKVKEFVIKENKIVTGGFPIVRISYAYKENEELK